MSSICGIIYRDGQDVAAHAIDRMIAAHLSWQPDHIGKWREGPAAFGHLALWSTPEAVTERCPFRERSSGIVVTADGRIDNRDDLIAALGQKDRPAAEIGDTELIGLSYLKWGEGCVTRLIGDFAFALWDPQKRRLFCGRDPMGLRSLYHFSNDRVFIFGTEIKALLAMPEVPQDEDPARFALFVAGLHVGDGTQIRSIRQLRPAHTLTVDGARLVTQCYWQLDPEREIRFRRDEDYVEAFEEIFQSAVDARLRTPGRAGCMLSGGLDATTMLAFALRSRQVRPDRISAYTWALREGDDWRTPDEREFVEAFLRENTIDHHYLVLRSEQVFEENPAIQWFQDGPILDFRHCMMSVNFADARDRNIKTMLMGDGGDETASYGAPDYFTALMLRLDWSGLRREAKAWASWAQTTEWQIWKSYIMRPLLRRDVFRSPFLAQQNYWEFHAHLNNVEKSDLPLTAGIVRSTNLLERYEGCQPRLGWAWRNPVRSNQIDMLTGTDVWARLVTSSNYSSLFGIECRFPYFDRRVIEFCVGVPPEQHRRESWARLLLRRSADRRIPAKIARRRDKSSTWPDILRGISQNDSLLRNRFARWEGHPRITAYLDLGKMRTQLRNITETTRTGVMGDRPPLGMFMRAVFLGMFLEQSTG